MVNQSVHCSTYKKENIMAQEYEKYTLEKESIRVSQRFELSGEMVKSREYITITEKKMLI